MIVIVVYFVGVVIGHILLRRLIKRRATTVDDTRRFRANRINPLFKWESTMYLRWIWLWPLYFGLILPVRYTWRGILRTFKWLGFGEVYRDLSNSIKNY